MSASELRKQSIRPGMLSVSRLAGVLAGLSALLLVVLASAPVRPYFAQWRQEQVRYNRLAASVGVPPIPIAIQQIWKPSLGIADRCVSCHLGMGTTTPLGADPLFKAHPPIPHDPSEYGCTVCHGGQGRATTKEAAHGFVSHWDEQLLDGQHRVAGCGSCHRDLPVASRADLARGQERLERFDCLSCHKVDGRGRGTAPDLSAVGLRSYRADWHQAHLAEREREVSGSWRDRYGEIPSADLVAIDAWLRTRVGATRLVDAQALALERGCLGCHKIAGRGGDEGPALDGVGRRPVGELPFTAVPGERTLSAYIRQHFIDPPGVVPGSLMPPLAMSNAEADLLTSYVLFLRSRELPAEYLPKPRVRRDLLREPTPPLTGGQVFGAFCAGCHGPDGSGRTYGNLDVRFPSIGSPDFLDVVTDDFITRTLRSGRPGRRMPALGAAGGSLDDRELVAVVAHLRSLTSPVGLGDVERARPDLAQGRAIYEADCAACHGRLGEGTVLGSPLSVAGRARSLTVAYRAIVGGVPGTAMPGYTIYDAQALRSLIAFADGLVGHAANGAAARRAVRGDPARGEDTFSRHCAGCHGAKGEGRNGPALANPGFQQVATTEMIAATVIRGRRGTPMPAFGRDGVGHRRLDADEALDVATFVATGFEAGARQ